MIHKVSIMKILYKPVTPKGNMVSNVPVSNIIKAVTDMTLKASEHDEKNFFLLISKTNSSGTSFEFSSQFPATA